MMQKTSNNIYRWIILISAFLALTFGAYSYSNWEIYKDDDGSMDSYWGFCGEPAAVLCKTFVLESAEGAKDAMVRYEMGEDPLNYQTKTSYSKPNEGVKWNNMVVMVNDVVVAKESPMKLGTKGWHRVQFDPKLLKKGENTVKFTWAHEGSWTNAGTEEGKGGFYLGIDTATHKERSSSKCGGKIFTTQHLNPWADKTLPGTTGEYMVRLFVAFSEQGAESQSPSNTAANAANP